MVEHSTLPCMCSPCSRCRLKMGHSSRRRPSHSHSCSIAINGACNKETTKSCESLGGRYVFWSIGLNNASHSHSHRHTGHRQPICCSRTASCKSLGQLW